MSKVAKFAAFASVGLALLNLSMTSLCLADELPAQWYVDAAAVEALTSEAKASIAAGDKASAIPLLEKAQKITPDDGIVDQEVHLLLDLGRVEQAMQALGPKPVLESNLTNYQLLKCEILLRAGKCTEALDLTYSMSPIAETYIVRSKILARLGRAADAKTAAEMAYDHNYILGADCSVAIANLKTLKLEIPVSVMPNKSENERVFKMIDKLARPQLPTKESLEENFGRPFDSIVGLTPGDCKSHSNSDLFPEVIYAKEKLNFYRHPKLTVSLSLDRACIERADVEKYYGSGEWHPGQHSGCLLSSDSLVYKRDGAPSVAFGFHDGRVHFVNQVLIEWAEPDQQRKNSMLTPGIPIAQ
ncbi:MAG TPA: hypothetical protein V6C72_14050 [Chroococcales cyanobacterium]